MPVLGGVTPNNLAAGAPSTTGRIPLDLALGTYTGAGFALPGGSLDRWYDGRRRSTSQLVEVVILGDSTFDGQTKTGPNYSPITRIRSRLISDGYSDGGHGTNGGLIDTPNRSGDPVSGVSAVTGFAAFDAYQIPKGLHSTTAADAATFSGYGTHIRIFYRYFVSSGQFTYSVDGGAAVTVTPVQTPAGSTVVNFDWINIAGLTDGLHTVTIGNVGQWPIPNDSMIQNAPGASTNNIATGSNIATAGTWYYKFTAFTAAGGETLPTAVYGPVTVAGNNSITGTFTSPSSAVTGYRIYRSTAATGTFTLTTTVTASGGTLTAFTDTNNATASTQPPTVGTAVDTSRADVNVGVDFQKTTGIVLHNLAQSGSSSNPYATAQNLEIFLGLTEGRPVSTPATSQPLDPRTGARRPCLVIWNLGINDQQGAGGTDTSATLTANTIAAGNAARHAGADFLICIPALEAANQSQLAPTYRAALKSAAATLGAPWIDLGLGGALPTVTAGSTSNDPHLTAAQYVTQGDYMWDQLLGVK